MPQVDLGTRLANIGILVFFIFMVSAICRAAFWGVSFRLPREASSSQRAGKQTYTR